MPQKILTGANLVVYVNARPYGLVERFTYTENTPSRENRGIDTVDTSELAPTRSDVFGTMEIWRLKGDGGLEGAGLKTHSRLMARARYFSLTLIDRVTDEVFFQADRCRVESQTWPVPIKQLVKGTVSWKALQMNNELSNG
jgi:hypothetical protein